MVHTVIDRHVAQMEGRRVAVVAVVAVVAGVVVVVVGVGR